MSNKRIIYTKPGGAAAVVIPSPEETVRIPHPVDPDVILEFARGGLPQAIGLLPVEVTEEGIITWGVSEPTPVSVGELIDSRLATHELNNIPNKPISYEVVDATEIPSNRSFRDAWEHDTTTSPQKIGVKTSKALDISLARVRAARNKALEDLDKEYTMASRTGSSTAGLDAQRNALLKATDELKALDVNNDGLISVEEVARTIFSKEISALKILI